MKQHPEQGEAEVFVGNAKFIPAHLAGLKSVRLGDVAFDIDGNRLDSVFDLHPMFVGAAEHAGYDRIQMGRLSAIKRGQTL